MPSLRAFRCHALALAVSVLAALTTPAPARAATPDELEARVDALAAQVVALQNEVADLKAQKLASTAAAPPATAAPLTMAADPAPAAEQRVQWFGYGELNY